MSQTKAQLVAGLNLNVSAPASALTVDSTGRVGIGTTSPTAQLTSASTVQITGFANPSGGAGLELGYDGTNSIVQSFNRGTSAFRDLQLSGNTIQMSIAGGEAARIDSSRRLLVGTSSTSSVSNTVLQGRSNSSTGGALLTIARGSNNPANNEELGLIYFADSGHTGAAIIEARRDGGTWTSGTSHPTRLAFATTADGASTPTERMRLTSVGRLSVRSDTTAPLNVLAGSAASATDDLVNGYHSSSDISTGTACIRIKTNGNVQNTNGSYTTISDAKLKENIINASSQWNDLKAIQIRNWNFKAETGHETHRQIGPIAQELETVCPGLVFETPDRDVDGNETGEVTKGVNQSVLYMKAVKALQEAMERIETLEARLTALETA